MIDSLAIARGLLRGAAGATKPMLVCFMGKESSREATQAIREAGFPIYVFPEDAARALHALVRYRTWLERPAGQGVRFADFRSAELAGLFDRARRDGREHLSVAESLRVLAAAGVPVVPWMEVSTAADAAEAADTLGYPVVVKVSSPSLVHKTERGGVRLGLQDSTMVRDTAHELLSLARPSDPAASLVVQQQIGRGTEVIFGASTDPHFGPMLMFGLGGVFVEVLQDVAFRLHPITDVDADEMLRSVRSFPILAGTRGQAAADLDLLKLVLLRLNQLLTDFPDIQEVDVNPFFAAPEANGCLAADARFRLSRPSR
jgi:acetate---CoA ligase (ADP-forming)